MGLTLHVDGDRWRAHLKETLSAHPGIVPVAKGNGYGFGIGRLARKAAWLGVETLAVGTYDEVADALTRFEGSVMVLSPWRPFERRVVYDQRVIHTVGRLEDLVLLAAREDRPRILLERMTSMLRHGLSARELRQAAGLISTRARPGVRGGGLIRGAGVTVEGVAIHLPMPQGSHQPEVERLMTDIVAAGLPTRRVFVSHLTDAELGRVRASYPDFEFRPRIGTQLWLGDRGALSVRATVLDCHQVERGDVFGYRGRTAPKSGTILVVSGGTAHGIGLEAPTGGATLKQRASTIARGGLDAAGFVRSPYTIDGKQRLFAEPPHMQASMLFLPGGAHVPEVGQEVGVRVRYTATTFDETNIS
ncbi:MAG TPA: alanine racemase [Nocardioidaceae bacterium]|nr:alanine racemase [Nocardioidaceae bacterium]